MAFAAVGHDLLVPICQVCPNSLFAFHRMAQRYARPDRDGGPSASTAAGGGGGGAGLSYEERRHERRRDDDRGREGERVHRFSKERDPHWPRFS